MALKLTQEGTQSLSSQVGTRFVGREGLGQTSPDPDFCGWGNGSCAMHGVRIPVARLLKE